MVSAGDVVDIADMVGTRHVIGLSRCEGGGPVAGPVSLQKAPREQAEVGLVSQIDEAQVGVVGLGCSLLVRRCLLVAVNTTAQQLLVL